MFLPEIAVCGSVWLHRKLSSSCSGCKSVATFQLFSMSWPAAGPKGAVSPYMQPLKTVVCRLNLLIQLVIRVPFQ